MLNKIFLAERQVQRLVKHQAHRTQALSNPPQQVKNLSVNDWKKYQKRHCKHQSVIKQERNISGFRYITCETSVRKIYLD